jgi:hypothetical protein
LHYKSIDRADRLGDDKIIPTKGEIRTILGNAPNTHTAMFITAIFTGMRITDRLAA